MATTFSAPSVPRARASQSGVPIWADTTQLSQLARDLAKAAPEAWKACRLSLRAAGQIVADDAKVRASFSTRIPGSIKVRTGKGSVKVVAGGPNAPDAAPLEHGGVAGNFRHPVFGNRGVWVNQPARPFLAPALDAHRDEVAALIEDAVMGAVARAVSGGLL